MSENIKFIQEVYAWALKNRIVSSKREFAKETGVYYSTISKLTTANPNNYGRLTGRNSATKVKLWQDQIRAKLENSIWDSFRREAAKDLLPLATQMKDYRDFPWGCVSLAIELADELIKQLKMEKK